MQVANYLGIMGKLAGGCGALIQAHVAVQALNASLLALDAPP